MVEKGKVINIIKSNDWTTQIIIRKKRNDIYLPICFSAYDESKRLVNQIGLEVGDVVKIDYHLYSKKYNEKYYTTAQIDRIKITQKKSQQLMVDLETGEIFQNQKTKKMENKEKKFFKEIYQANKNQMIKIKEGKIIGIDLIAKIKNSKSTFSFNLEIEFKLDVPIQKEVANQGFLLPYKFSKFIEKAKVTLFSLSNNNQISSELMKICFREFNQIINEEVEKILLQNTKGFGGNVCKSN